MTPDQRDIVLVPVPFTDLSATKRRPVVVLSKTSHNRKAGDALVAAITSNLAAGGPGVVVSSSDLSSGALPVDSLVRVDKLYALSKSNHHQTLQPSEHGLVWKGTHGPG